jgi:HAD superfamily hydrolase (TIGR01509 family)
MLRALVFDFDGLILDTETPSYEAWREVFEEHGTTLPLSLWIDIIGRPPGEHAPLLLLEQRIGRPVDRGRLLREQLESELARIERESVLPGAETLIAAADRAGVRLAVASSSEMDWVETHLRRLGLRDRFQVLSCASSMLPGKPAPDVYLHALRGLGVAAAEAVALEDSLHGVTAANAAGITSVAVPGVLLREATFAHAALRVDSLERLTIERLAALLGEAGGIDRPRAATRG